MGGGHETGGKDLWRGGVVDAGAETGVHAVEGGLDGGGFVGAQDHGAVAGGALDPVVEEAAEADGIEGCFDGPGGVVFAAGASVAQSASSPSAAMAAAPPMNSLRPNLI